MECENLKHAMDLLIAKHGHSQIIYLLSASISWNAKWAPRDQHGSVARAGYLLGQVAEILERIEQAEELERAASKGAAGAQS